MRLKLVTILATTLGLMLSTAVSAEEDFDCGSVRFGKVNWTGVSIKTATASWMLEQLGYNTEVTSASAPIVYQTIKGGELDVFLGQWMPSQRQVFRPFAREGSIDVVSPNLQGGKYTIGVPSYVYEAGVTSIEDLDAHKERFGGEIFGIEPGSGGNTTLTRMIEDDYAGLGDWELVASSEPGMLSEVRKRERSEEWIAFLAWSPHPMNVNHDLKYLSGGESYSGPNKGEVIVNTVTRKGYAWACANVGQFLDNYDYTVAEQSRAMDYVNNEDMEYLEAGKRLIREKPELLDRWFSRSGIYQTGGITTTDGERDAREVIADALGL